MPTDSLSGARASPCAGTEHCATQNRSQHHRGHAHRIAHVARVVLEVARAKLAAVGTVLRVIPAAVIARAGVLGHVDGACARNFRAGFAVDHPAQGAVNAVELAVRAPEGPLLVDAIVAAELLRGELPHVVGVVDLAQVQVREQALQCTGLRALWGLLGLRRCLHRSGGRCRLLDSLVQERRQAAAIAAEKIECHVETPVP
jgi:hypothetical protein